ncbi:glutamate-cysteine ligase family protein [Actinomadura harenae]|uniref:Glutamate--cysteine ligase n=1 Tax=Actinomadura harenae TaxID=2483351 RepID=A0A3M2LYD9_9ACTN|nr:glutamate-cysteine ligase family protein [Actinomadura harenae]RMI42419.1 glutamate--cysteine ligase [Actinomadura harenae]
MTTSELRSDDLKSLFTPASAERVGLEIESGVVDPETGRAAPFAGERGVGAVLRTVLAEWGGKPVHDAGELVGVRLDDEGLIGLEHGGQLEYSAPPAADVVTAVADVRRVLERLAEVVGRHGLALVPGAHMPFDRIETIPWVPLDRGRFMRDHFARLGVAGDGGPEILSMSTSTQVHLDYLSEEDFAEKLRMQVAASPVVAALFVNSPLDGGRLDGLLSHRSRNWTRTDPRRCGVVPPALGGRFGFEDVIDWALGIPMIYYQDGAGRLRRAPDRPFVSVLQEGFDDGSRPGFEHWVAHMTQIWTHVRVRGTLELRAADGPAYPHLAAVPALWTGLSYHPPTRTAAWELLRHYTVAEQSAAVERLPAEGLRTRLGGDRVHELAAELVRLARTGLQARVGAGLEGAEALHYLDPLEEVLDTGRTFAEQCAQRWRTDLRGEPRRYVAAYRV